MQLSYSKRKLDQMYNERLLVVVLIIQTSGVNKFHWQTRHCVHRLSNLHCLLFIEPMYLIILI